MHLDDERIQRLLHGELNSADEQPAKEHLAVCAECRALLERSRAEERRIFGLLGELDHPLPAADVRAVLGVSSASRPGWQRWAAGFLLVAVGAGVVYAAPGSPLPSLVDRLVAWVAPTSPPADQARTTEETPQLGAGIAVPPGERLTIRVEAPRDSAVATVALIEGDEVAVRALEGSATFASGEGRLSVQSAGRVRLEILIPRTAAVEIVVGEQQVFRVERARVLTATPRDSAGRYLLALSEGGR